MKEIKYRKTEDGINIMFANDRLTSGIVQTIDFRDLKTHLEKKGWGNILGFRINRRGLDVFTDKLEDITSSWEIYKKTFRS
jgi:hypothetical protein